MNKRRKKKKRYKIKNILMLVIIIFLIVKLFSVLINSGKDNKDEIVKKSEPKTYLNKVNKTDNYNEDIDNKNDTVTVKVLENDYFYFDFMKDIESKVYEVENTFVLKKTNNTYKIKSLRKVQDFYVMITNEYKTGKSDKDAKKELDKMKEDYISDFKDEVTDFKTYLSRYENKKDNITKTCD